MKKFHLVKSLIFKTQKQGKFLSEDWMGMVNSHSILINDLFNIGIKRLFLKLLIVLQSSFDVK